MLTRRRADAPKIEPYRQQPRVHQPRGRSKNDLVMHCPAAERMRVTDEADAPTLAGRFLDDRFELPVRGRDVQVAFWIHL